MNGDIQEMIDAVIMAENAEKMKGEEEKFIKKSTLRSGFSFW